MDTVDAPFSIELMYYVILERARISGHALNKVSTAVFTQILNYCLNVASGDSLIKIADEKVSAVHGGDPKDYAILEMLPLFQKVKDYLDTEYPGCRFLTASFDHSLALAIWSLDGQSDQLLDTYRRELAAKGLNIARQGTPRNFLQSMKARSRSTRPQRTILMDWASRSCPPSRR